MKKILSIAFICAISIQAHAGIWDSITGFFGDDDKEVKEIKTVAPEVQKPSEKSTKSTASLMKTGLQLLPLLTQGLNVTNEQAKGGTGAILQAVQGLLSQTEYGALLSAIPGAKGLLSAAPLLESKSQSGQLLDSAIDIAGKNGKSLKQGANLVSQFQTLGLGADMIPKFAEVTSNYLSNGDKPETSDLLNTALSKLGGIKL